MIFIHVMFRVGLLGAFIKVDHLILNVREMDLDLIVVSVKLDTKSRIMKIQISSALSFLITIIGVVGIQMNNSA